MDDIKPPRRPQPEETPPKFNQLNEAVNNNPLSEVKLEQSNSSSEETKKTPDLAMKPPKKHMSRKKKIIIVAITAAVLIISGVVYWFFLKPSDQTENQKPVIEQKAPVETKPISPLTGVELSSEDLAKRPVTGLMIENSMAARPQSGVVDAGVIFEAVAEGGITRFLALYQESTPQTIGPVRSARPYFVDFNLSFDASFGHVGGSPDAMNDIKTLGVKDLDQFYNSGAYWRSSDRAAPHNMYTGFERLDALNQSKGYTSSNFTPFERKKDVPQTPTASGIDFAISSYLYNANFVYDQASNSYKRSEGGATHTDQQTGAQISPKVVIALVMGQGLRANGSHTTYQDTGSGQMYVFQDGIVSTGTWSKADKKSQFTFTDKNGLPMKLNTGQTWISIVGAASYVSYTP